MFGHGCRSAEARQDRASGSGQCQSTSQSWPGAAAAGHRRAARARRRRRPAAATSTEQNPTHSLSAVVSPAAFWNSPRGQPAAATAYGATAETAVEGTAGGATASLAAATGAQEAFDAAVRRECTSVKRGGQECSQSARWAVVWPSRARATSSCPIPVAICPAPPSLSPPRISWGRAPRYAVGQ